jgi:hypothetical protein
MGTVTIKNEGTYVSGGTAANIRSKWTAWVMINNGTGAGSQYEKWIEPVSWSQDAAPKISEATFAHIMATEGAYYPGTSTPVNVLPNDLADADVAIHVGNANASRLAWVGIFQDRSAGLEGNGRGDLTLTAYGYENRLRAAGATMHGAWVKQGAVAKWVDWVPPINGNLGKGSSGKTFGNMSSGTVTINGLTVHCYDLASAGSQPWTAKLYADYVLALFGDVGFCQLAIEGQTDLIESYYPTQHVEGLTAWDILCKVMPRHRGVTWNVALTSDTTLGIVVRNATELPISLTNGTEIEGNPDVYDLNFDDSHDIISPQLGQTIANRYSRVVATGERMRATFTAGVTNGSNVRLLTKGWTGSTEAEYKAIVGDPVYTAPWQLAEHADAQRAKTKYDRVFKHFILDSACDGFSDDENGSPKSVFPAWDADCGVIDQTQVLFPINAGNGFMPHLPFLEGEDYAGDADLTQMLDFRRPFGLILDTYNLSGNRYIFLDKMMDAEFFKSYRIRLPQNELAVSLPGAGNTFAKGSWTDAENLDPGSNHHTQSHALLDYRDLQFTLQVEMDERISYGCSFCDGALDRTFGGTLEIRVDNCHYWYVHPMTVVDIDTDGTLIYYYESADYAARGCGYRDDSAKLVLVCNLAGQWYKKERAILTYGAVGFPEHIPIGGMVNAITTDGLMSNVKTPVTRKLYTWVKEEDGWMPVLSVGTSHVDLDIASFGGAGYAGGHGASLGGPPERLGIMDDHRALKRCAKKIRDLEDRPVDAQGGDIIGGGRSRLHIIPEGEYEDKDVTIFINEGAGDHRGPLGASFNSEDGVWYSDKAKWG